MLRKAMNESCARDIDKAFSGLMGLRSGGKLPEKGATTIEYALSLALIALVVVPSVFQAGESSRATFFMVGYAVGGGTSGTLGDEDVKLSGETSNEEFASNDL